MAEAELGELPGVVWNGKIVQLSQAIIPTALSGSYVFVSVFFFFLFCIDRRVSSTIISCTCVGSLSMPQSTVYY